MTKKSEKSSLTQSKELMRNYKSFDNPSVLEMSGINTQDVLPDQKKKKSQIKRNSSLLSLKSINQNIRSMLKLTKNEENFLDCETKSTETTELVTGGKKTLPVTPSLKISIYNEVYNVTKFSLLLSFDCFFFLSRALKDTLLLLQQSL